MKSELLPTCPYRFEPVCGSSSMAWPTGQLVFYLDMPSCPRTSDQIYDPPHGIDNLWRTYELPDHSSCKWGCSWAFVHSQSWWNPSRFETQEWYVSCVYCLMTSSMFVGWDDLEDWLFWSRFRRAERTSQPASHVTEPHAMGLPSWSLFRGMQYSIIIKLIYGLSDAFFRRNVAVYLYGREVRIDNGTISRSAGIVPWNSGQLI